MHELEYVLENKEYIILRDIEIQTGHIILSKLEFLVINKEKMSYGGCWYPSGPQS